MTACSLRLDLGGFFLNIHLFPKLYSAQGETVMSILIDLNGFWTYENREVLVMQESQGASEV